MQLVPPRLHDADNGYSWIIQNVYKVRQMVPSAMPKPVSVDEGLLLLETSGISNDSGPVSHPSKWSDAPTFDPLSFLASVSNDAFGPPRPQSHRDHNALADPVPVVQWFKTPAILKPIARSPTAKATLASPGPQVSITSATGNALASLASSVISTPPTASESSSHGHGGLDALLTSLRNRERYGHEQRGSLMRNLFHDEPLEDASDDYYETASDSLPPLRLLPQDSDIEDPASDSMMPSNASSPKSPPAARIRRRVKAPPKTTSTVAVAKGTGKRRGAKLRDRHGDQIDDTVTALATAPSTKRLRLSKDTFMEANIGDVIVID